jgi:hypothetical protein
MKKSLWQHEKELETLYIKRDEAIKMQLTSLVDCYNHSIFMKATFIDQNFFENIPLENIDPNNY